MLNITNVLFKKTKFPLSNIFMPLHFVSPVLIGSGRAWDCNILKVLDFFFFLESYRTGTFLHIFTYMQQVQVVKSRLVFLTNDSLDYASSSAADGESYSLTEMVRRQIGQHQLGIKNRSFIHFSFSCFSWPACLQILQLFSNCQFLESKLTQEIGKMQIKLDSAKTMTIKLVQ